MHLDVLDLRTFYYRTRLGRVAQRAVRAQMRRFWPEANGASIAGFGFAVPLLRPYMQGAARVIALMPGPQGVMAWPEPATNVAVLCEETLWPVRTGSLDRLVLLHGLETSQNAGALLAECYRVLAPEGRALFVVPNRAGLWAKSDATPFGFGRPYSLGQLEAQLRDYDFLPQDHAAALFQPPVETSFWMRAGGMIEGAGRALAGRYAGGLLMVDAKKRVPARAGGLGAAVRRPLRVLDGVPRPVPGAARASSGLWGLPGCEGRGALLEQPQL